MHSLTMYVHLYHANNTHLYGVELVGLDDGAEYLFCTKIFKSSFNTHEPTNVSFKITELSLWYI